MVAPLTRNTVVMFSLPVKSKSSRQAATKNRSQTEPSQSDVECVYVVWVCLFVDLLGGSGGEPGSCCLSFPQHALHSAETTAQQVN